MRAKAVMLRAHLLPATSCACSSCLTGAGQGNGTSEGGKMRVMAVGMLLIMVVTAGGEQIFRGLLDEGSASVHQWVWG